MRLLYTCHGWETKNAKAKTGEDGEKTRPVAKYLAHDSLKSIHEDQGPKGGTVEHSLLESSKV